MNHIIIPVEMEQLDQMIQSSVRKAFATATPILAEKPKDQLNFDEAGQLLNRSKSWLSKKTMKKEIPFSKFGSRLVFSRKDLEAWLESQTIPMENPGEVMAERLAISASKKGGKK